MNERLERIELSPYCDDIYSFVIYKYHLRHKFNPKNRKKSDIMKFLKEANVTLDELLEEWNKQTISSEKCTGSHFLWLP